MSNSEQWSDWIPVHCQSDMPNFKVMGQWKGDDGFVSCDVNLSTVKQFSRFRAVVAYRYRLQDSTATEKESGMHPDLEWLARNVSEWKAGYDYLAKRLDSDGVLFETVENANYEQHNDYYGIRHTKAQWHQARQDLGLIMTDEEEEMEAPKWVGSVSEGVKCDLYEEIKEGFEHLANNRSDGSTASYYELPEGCTQLQDLISHRNLNAQDGEIFRAIYRKGRASHSDDLRDAKKVLFYAKAEVERLEKAGSQ